MSLFLKLTLTLGFKHCMLKTGKLNDDQKKKLKKLIWKYNLQSNSSNYYVNFTNTDSD